MNTPNMYDPRITARKAANGTIDGAIAAILCPLVMQLAKIVLPSMDGNTETALSTLIGAAVSAVVIGIKRGYQNWRKHK